MRTILLSTLLLLSVVLASALKTLNSEEDLQNTEFGQAPLHHGLRLLKWYVNKCLDNNMKALCNPVDGEYGFHQFFNDKGLLRKIKDDVQFGYFSIGNLISPHAEDLPDDVKKDLKRLNFESNMDRVLVKYNKSLKRITDIFISEHYNRDKTYIIGPELLRILRDQTPKPVDQGPSIHASPSRAGKNTGVARSASDRSQSRSRDTITKNAKNTITKNAKNTITKNAKNTQHHY